MKKIISFLILAAMAATLFAGCGRKSDGRSVSTDGSTSMEKVIGALGEAFEQDNDGVTFTYNPTGSGTGIQAVCEDRCDIGLSSRSLKDEETVKDGSYVVQRPFVLVTKEDKKLSETAQKFFDYVTSSDASDIISKAGVVPNSSGRSAH